MRELESSLQQFGEFLLKARLDKARLDKETAAPYCVRFVRQFLTRPANDGPPADRVQQFCEHLDRAGAHDWQVHQAEQALRIYFVNFLNRTDWRTGGEQASIDAEGRVDPLPALEALRARIRTRHYSYRTECSYVDWLRRAVSRSRGPRLHRGGTQRGCPGQARPAPPGCAQRPGDGRTAQRAAR